MEVVGLLIDKYEDEQVPELEESSAVREDSPISQADFTEKKAQTIMTTKPFDFDELQDAMAVLNRELPPSRERKRGSFD